MYVSSRTWKSYIVDYNSHTAPDSIVLDYGGWGVLSVIVLLKNITLPNSGLKLAAVCGYVGMCVHACMHT